MPIMLCWLVLVSLSLGVGIQQLGLPWWANFLIGLAGGVGLLWLVGLAMCHRGTEVLRWTHQEDETTTAPRGLRRPTR